MIFLDKPGRPEGPIKFTDISADTLTVHWKEPLDKGGMELSKYILEKCEASKQIWTKVCVACFHYKYFPVF